MSVDTVRFALEGEDIGLTQFANAIEQFSLLMQELLDEAGFRTL